MQARAPAPIPGESPEELICSLLRSGRDAEDLLAANPPLLKAVMGTARSEGIAPLLAKRLRRLPGVPPRLAATLRHQRVQIESLELLREERLRQLLDALAAAGIDAVLMKGAALAYWLYASPGLRPRTDNDLLIREADIASARAVLEKLGYEVAAGDTSSALNYQFMASRPLANGQADIVDVHWRISNRLEFSRQFYFEELNARAIPLPAIGPSAIGLGLADSLLLACMHRIGHLNEGEPERLIWLYDIHLLVEALNENATPGFVSLMQDKGLTAVCDNGIARAARCFGTRIPTDVTRALGTAHADEHSRSLLDAGPLKTLWLQCLAQPDWRHRWFFLRELAFPPRDHMRRKYPAVRAPLWWLYIRRGVEGLLKRLRRKPR